MPRASRPDGLVVRPDGLLPQCSRMGENRPMGSGVQPTGTRIAGYEIEELIGRGGMGEVYRALDPSLERPVALKLLLPNLAEDAGFRERMLRESRLAASLDHPNVVPIDQAGDADGRPFIATRTSTAQTSRRFCAGTACSSRPVPSQSRPRSQMHSTQPMHRGSCTGMSSPRTSCLTSREGASTHTLPISDLTQSASDRQPTDGSLMGSVDYVAPEQIRLGTRSTGVPMSTRSGCLLFEALTGSLPFSDPSEAAVLGPASPRRPSRRQRASTAAAAESRRGACACDGEGPGFPAADGDGSSRRGCVGARSRAEVALAQVARRPRLVPGRSRDRRDSLGPPVGER